MVFAEGVFVLAGVDSAAAGAGAFSDAICAGDLYQVLAAIFAAIGSGFGAEGA